MDKRFGSFLLILIIALILVSCSSENIKDDDVGSDSTGSDVSNQPKGSLGKFEKVLDWDEGKSDQSGIFIATDNDIYVTNYRGLYRKSDSSWDKIADADLIGTGQTAITHKGVDYLGSSKGIFIIEGDTLESIGLPWPSSIRSGNSEGYSNFEKSYPEVFALWKDSVFSFFSVGDDLYVDAFEGLFKINDKKLTTVAGPERKLSVNNAFGQVRVFIVRVGDMISHNDKVYMTVRGTDAPNKLYLHLGIGLEDVSIDSFEGPGYFFTFDGDAYLHANSGLYKLENNNWAKEISWNGGTFLLTRGVMGDRFAVRDGKLHVGSNKGIYQLNDGTWKEIVGPFVESFYGFVTLLDKKVFAFTKPGLIKIQHDEYDSWQGGTFDEWQYSEFFTDEERSKLRVESYGIFNDDFYISSGKYDADGIFRFEGEYIPDPEDPVLFDSWKKLGSVEDMGEVFEFIENNGEFYLLANDGVYQYLE